MANVFSHISIEKFAAFLEGNLPQDEMQQFSHLIAENDSLQQIMDSSDLIDETLSNYAEEDMQLPQEMEEHSFELPPTMMEGFYEQNPLMPESIPFEHYAAAAFCDDDPLMMTSDADWEEDANSLICDDSIGGFSAESDIVDSDLDIGNDII